jgi:acetyl esterase/lipase
MSLADAQTMRAIRDALGKAPKFRFQPGSRAAYDQIIAQAPAPATVAFELGELRGVPGWWCRPARSTEGTVVLYLHGGGYVIGSASAYRNFVGRIAEQAQATTFIADYALAPERPFPAAMNDLRALHEGLVAGGYERIALAGDSAGAGLALSFLTGNVVRPQRIVGVVAMSPWIDLSLSGESMASRESDDPLLSKATLEEAATFYLGAQSANDRRLSPLDGDIATMAPVRIHVGDAEVLLDDSLRFTRKADQAGLNCETHVWEGMIHVFPSNFAALEAAAAAVEDIGAFLAGMLGSRP